MCLKIDKSKHQLINEQSELDGYKCETTKTTKTVYKIFIINIYGHLMTPIMGMILHTNHLNEGLFTDDTKFEDKTLSCVYDAIHAYTNVNEAISTLESFIRADDFSTIIVPMYIPKGTKIWYGHNHTIAAQKMCFKKDSKIRFKNNVLP